MELASSYSANPPIQRQSAPCKTLLTPSVSLVLQRVPTRIMRANLARRKWALPTLATVIALLRVCDSFVLPGAATSLRQHHDAPPATTTEEAAAAGGWQSTAHSRPRPAPAASTPVSRSAAPCRASVAAVKRSRVQMTGAKGAAMAAAAEIDEDERVQAESLRAKNDQEWQFFDTSRINVKAGMGGNGCVAMRREKGISMGGPNGGSGGRGGSIFLRCSEGLNTLAMVRHKVHYRATDGQNGQGKSRTGNAGVDIFVSAPIGTVVRDQDGSLCGELTKHGQELLIARGGRGGRGNEAFKSNRARAPRFGENGEPGGERWVSLELKLVADVGFVGVPNAGKSTLLAVSSNAKPKIADYPFTTVVPNLGVCDVLGADDEGAAGLVLADIPGLLEGAHDGVGLGLAFLRHVQRCRVLVHLVSGDSVDPMGDYRAIQQELELFSPKLLEKQQVVVLNKIDLPHVRSQQAELEESLKAELGHSRFMSISAVTGENTQELMRRLRKLVNALPPVDDLFDGEAVKELDTPATEDTGFEIETDPAFPGQFRVTGTRIVQIAKMTIWDYYEAVQRFQRVMEAMGVDAALKEAGAKTGDLIMIDQWDFDYQPELSSVYLQGLDNMGNAEDGAWIEEAYE